MAQYIPIERTLDITEYKLKTRPNIFSCLESTFKFSISNFKLPSKF